MSASRTTSGIGDKCRLTQVEGVIEVEGYRPVGGIEMGDKQRARAVIVVHGVGSQERGATFTTLMQAIGGLAPGGTGIEVVACGDVLVRPPDEPDMSLGSPRARGECTSTYCPHAELRWSNGETPRSWPFYEFYWADESRVGHSVWNQARSYWQILTGLPRLGLYALDGPAGNRPRLVDGAARFFYVIAWAALVPRLMVALLMGGCRLAGHPAAIDVLYYPFAWADVIRTGADLLFILALVVWWLWPSRRDRKICGNVVITALLALTTATVLTDLVPLGLRYNPFTMLGVLVQSIREKAIPPPSPYDPDTYDPRSSYVFNTVTGLLWVLGYLLILLWMVWTSIRAFAAWLCRPLRGPQRARTDDTIGQQTRHATQWWIGVGLVLLVLHPLAFNYDWFTGRGKPDWWTLITFHAKPEDQAQVNENWWFHLYDFAIRLTVGPIALASFVLLTNSHIREFLVPGLELALDVLNYLPPRRFIDAWAVSRFLLGGRRSAEQLALADMLDVRLRELIKLAVQRHGVPVQVVAHSLGSIITLSSLENWPNSSSATFIHTTPASNEPSAPNNPPRLSGSVDLITMGSPLMLLAERLPYAYGQARPDVGRRNLPAVFRWRNYYFDQDIIGRSLDRQIAAPANTSLTFEPDLRLGDGTHTDYFVDPRFACVLSG